MIRVTPAPEPATFQDRVRDRFAGDRRDGRREAAQASGRRFQKIADRREDIPADKFPPYWTESLDDLMRLYNQICAYSCFRIHPVTGSRSVDHMAARSHSHDRVYEWQNYRLARRSSTREKMTSVMCSTRSRSLMAGFSSSSTGFKSCPTPD